jgi:23S rRNA (uracil1939-C5)-methyltransferase
VKTVVAVSCDAGSFARDAEVLVSGGYALKRVTAVDQFKWSSHVEIVALFTR